MEQRKSPADSQSGIASPAPPPWMRRTAPYAAERRAKMLEHMARARSLPQPQAAIAQEPSRKSGAEILTDLIGPVVVFGIMALIFQSRIPLYLGAFLVLTDGERIESALGAIGIRFEPDAIGPDIVKGFASWFGWFALLASLKGSAPSWLVPWLPPNDSWSVLAGVALALAIVETVVALATRRALRWFGFGSRPDSLTWSTIKFVAVLGVMALLVLLRAV